jgi:ribosomal protein L12E/L44/L45/RPP1/RPP2
MINVAQTMKSYDEVALRIEAVNRELEVVESAMQEFRGVEHPKLRKHTSFVSSAREWIGKKLSNQAGTVNIAELDVKVAKLGKLIERAKRTLKKVHAKASRGTKSRRRESPDEDAEDEETNSADSDEEESDEESDDDRPHRKKLRARH